MPFTIADHFPREIRIARAISLACSAEAAWEIVGNLADTLITEGMVERVEVDGGGTGAMRRFHIPGGICIVERIEHYDPVDLCYVYRIIDHGPLPFTNYLGRAQVMAAGPSNSTISWSALAQPLDGQGDAARAAIETSIEHALAALSRRFNPQVSR